MSAFLAFLDLDERPVHPGWAEETRCTLAAHGDRIVHRASGRFRCAFAAAPVWWQPEIAQDDEGNLIAGMVRLDARDALASATGVRIAQGGIRGDASLMLAAHRRWGRALLDRVAGDFSFALWNGAERRLIAATDQFGARPLFHAQRQGQLVLSDSLAAIRALPGVDATLDETQLADMICLGFGLDPAATIHAGIRRLPPGHRLVFSGGNVRVERYWAVPPRAPTQFERRPGEHGETLRALLRESVADRLPAEAPIGILMSGGLDSTAVAATVSDILGRDEAAARVTAYTTVLRDVLEEEGQFAAMVTDRLGIRAQQLVAEEFTHRPMPRDARLLPEPTLLLAFAPAAAAAEEVALGGGVLLGGIGADVLLSPLDAGLAGIFRSEPWRAPWTLLRHLTAYGRLPLSGVRSGLIRSLRDRPQATLPGWINRDLADRTHMAERLADYRADANRTRAAGMTGMFWTRSLSMGSSSMSGFSMESAHPFFDVRLTGFMRSLPEALLRQKRVLREAMRPLLPLDVVDRPKTALGAVGHIQRGSPAVQARHRAVIEDDQFLEAYFDLAALRREIDNPGVATSMMLIVAESVAFWLRGHVSREDER